MERFLVLDKNRLQQSRRGKGSFQLHSFKQLKNRLLVRKQRKGILVMRVEKRMRVEKGMGVEKGMVVMGVRERMLVVKVRKGTLVVRVKAISKREINLNVCICIST